MITTKISTILTIIINFLFLLIIKLLSFKDRRSLQGVQIGISRQQISVSDSFAMCGEVSENANILSGSWITVICSPSQLSGRYVIVKKTESAPYKPDSVSIAEIRIYVTDGTHDYVGGRPSG